MARRTTAAAALLALGTLAACAAPDAIAPSASSALNLQEAATSGDLPVLASARTNKTEPAHLDRGRFNITLQYAVPVTPAVSVRATPSVLMYAIRLVTWSSVSCPR